MSGTVGRAPAEKTVDRPRATAADGTVPGRPVTVSSIGAWASDIAGAAVGGPGTSESDQ